MNAKVVMTAIAAGVLTLYGCTSAPRTGIVGWQSVFSAGSFAPDIPFTSMEGKQTTFNKVRGTIAIVAFLGMPGQACCSLNPQLVNLANRFGNLGITVAQISLPVGKCQHGPDCAEVCNLDQSRLIALCDKDRIAWKAYSQPDLNTVFLIDENSKVVDMATLDKIRPLADKAETMALVKMRPKIKGGKPS